MPALNEKAVQLTVATGLMFDCDMNTFSTWDRKNYFYPDMPKNFQISQFDHPLCVGGEIPIESEVKGKAIRLTRIHLEEDVAKNTHHDRHSSIDFNRAGTPLMEIVTEPDMESANEALAFLQALKQALAYGEISDCNLEEGNIRCDINCSVRPVGQSELGAKTEIKNMNTFKGVHRALSYEIRRQISERQKGRTIVQETRRWNEEDGMTHGMRSKEDAHEYRYFPEPDLVPVILSQTEIDRIRASLPELPQHRRIRLVQEYGIPEYDAEVLASDRAAADFFEAAAKVSRNYKSASNWVMTEILRVLSENRIEIEHVKVTPEALGKLIQLVDRGVINRPAAKTVFQGLLEEGGDPEAVVKAKGLAQVSDIESIEAIAQTAIDENPSSVEDYQAGTKKALQHLVGQVMRLSKGKANPQIVMEILRKKLDQ